MIFRHKEYIRAHTTGGGVAGDHGLPLFCEASSIKALVKGVGSIAPLLF